MFASVRFFKEPTSKTHLRPISQIQFFKEDDAENLYNVQYKVDDEGKPVYEPAQVLATSGKATFLTSKVSWKCHFLGKLSEKF